MTIDENQLLDLAGPRAFERGETYFRDGRVALSSRTATGFEARAEGSASYRLWFRNDAGEPAWDCSCPAAADGDFCKHLVAAALAWIEGTDTGVPQSPEDELLQALKREPRERLAEWLHEAAMDDGALADRLRLRLTDEPKEIKKILSSMLDARGFLDYRRSLDYAMQLDEPLAILRDLLDRDPTQCLALAEYALSRLLRVCERADDSSGGIGFAMRQFAELHARAAAQASPDGAKLAASLFKLKQKEEWNLFPLEGYWDALGKKGRAAYVRRVEKEYAALPAQPPDRMETSQRSDEFPIIERRKELAEMEKDFDTLIAVLSRDLSFDLAYRRIVTTCREYGRDALAMNWAERGLKAHPKSSGMCVLAAEEYQRAGLTEEARSLLWRDLLERPAHDSWLRLREAAGEDWPALRDEALAEFAARERRREDGRSDATLRVSLLILEGDLETARQLALENAVQCGTLKHLAEKIGSTHPRDAAAFLRRVVDVELVHADAKTYASIVPYIRRAVDLDPGDDASCWIADIRQRYKARRKLMGLMDKAGL